MVADSDDSIYSFQDLRAWQVNHRLVLAVYNMTRAFPSDEKFGVTSQMRRAASSITANIAEGWARYHFKDKLRFYYQGRGSWAETQNFLILSRDLGYIDTASFTSSFAATISAGKVLNGLIRAVEKQVIVRPQVGRKVRP